jgi:hypothetical protein
MPMPLYLKLLISGGVGFFAGAISFGAEIADIIIAVVAVREFARNHFTRRGGRYGSSKRLTLWR